MCLQFREHNTSLSSSLSGPCSMVASRAFSVIATQLPVEVTRREIQDYFSIVGPVKKCHLVRDKDGSFKGLAYIVYSVAENAKEAVDKLNNSPLNGKIIKVKFSRQRDNEASNNKPEAQAEIKDEASKEQEKDRKKRKRKEENKEKIPKKQRHGRIIIRNLSFKANEKVVEEHFSQYGNISEVSILRKPNGLMVGCAFVQFSTKMEALRAIKECNMKPLLGRPIAVDLAVAKERFDAPEVKVEAPEEEESTQVKEEELLGSGYEDGNVADVKIKEEKMSSDDDDDDSGLDEGEETDSEFDDEEEEEEDEDEKPSVEKGKPAFTEGPSKDVAEERTLFIKNLSYEATEEDIAGILQKYGELKYVLLCLDQLTQHPKGTAFAQFQEREAADSCLEAEKNPVTKHTFVLHGRPMYIMRAISREELRKRKDDKEKAVIPNDKRNLYLAREGFVRQGTQAAVGVSKSDVALRTKREQVKRRMLQNLHIFVSSTRLCVHNLPERITDKALNKLFKTHAPAGATLTEARVMRDLRNIDETGKPKSRGYGFVTFTEHEHALAVLRKVNNNPEIFSNEQRPIVEFSLENRSVLKAREKRMEKSKEKNPLWKNKGNLKLTNKKGGHVTTQKTPKKETQETEAHTEFMGAKSNPENRELPANYGPKIRHNRSSSGKGKISRKQFRKEKKDRALGRKRKRPQNEAVEGAAPEKKSMQAGGESKPKKNNNKRKKLSKSMQAEIRSERSFNKMVQNYKKKMSSVDSSSSKKWYED